MNIDKRAHAAGHALLRQADRLAPPDLPRIESRRRVGRFALGLAGAGIGLVVAVGVVGLLRTPAPLSSATPPSSTVSTMVELTATTDAAGLELDPRTVVDFDGAAFESGLTLGDEAVQAYASEVGVNLEDALRILQFQAAAPQAMGDLNGVFGDRFVESIFARDKPELTIIVTYLKPTDREWLDAINAQPTGGNFLILEDPGIANPGPSSPIHDPDSPLIISQVNTPVGAASVVSEVLLRNRSAEAVNLAGWILTDSDPPVHRFELPNTTVAAGTEISIVYMNVDGGCTSEDTERYIYWCSRDPDGDGVTYPTWDVFTEWVILLAPDGSTASRVEYETAAYKDLIDN